MFVMTRRAYESIHIGEDITVTVVRVGPNSVRLGITAPRDMNIARDDCGSPPPGPIQAADAACGEQGE